MTDLQDSARRMAAAALAAVDPERLVRERVGEQRFDAVLAVGKAAAGLARGARGVPDPPAKRLLIRPHTSPPLGDPGWEELSGGHPLPDRFSLAAGERLRDWLVEIGPDETLLALVSGGSSACIELPADGLSLNDVIRENRRLLASGLPIGEVNAVRKRLSLLKGGGALRLTRGRVVVLVLSDVPGDDPATVGSGLFEGAEATLLGSVRTAVAGAAAEARRQGFAVAEGDLEGEASTAGRSLVERGRSVSGGVGDSVALILGGETAVTLSEDHGRGGRNGELALAAARDLSEGEVVLALATDGEDGLTGTAGAVVDHRTWSACPDPPGPGAALARHDSLTALEAVPGALLRTGVTGTNVGDLALYLRRMK